MRRRSLNSAVPLLVGFAGLAGRRTASAQAAGRVSLFNGKDFAGWDRLGDANWRVEEGMLVADAGTGFLVTKSPYGDFELRAEFWVDPGSNSGVFIRATDPATITSANAYEVNIWDERPEPKFGTGAIVDVAAVDPMPKAGGRWNAFEITAKGDAFTVVLNGQKTVDGARDAKHPVGCIALQHAAGLKDAKGVPNDRNVVRFRKVDLKPL